MELSSSRLKKLLYFFKKSFSYISEGTSKTSKTKIYYASPKKGMNKFFQKHFRIIVFLFSIN